MCLDHMMHIFLFAMKNKTGDQQGFYHVLYGKVSHCVRYRPQNTTNFIYFFNFCLSKCILFYFSYKCTDAQKKMKNKIEIHNKKQKQL